MDTFAGRTKIEKARHKFASASDATHRRICHTRTKIALLRNLPCPNIESSSFEQTAEINARRRLQTSMYNAAFNEFLYRNQGFANDTKTQQMTRAFWRTRRQSNMQKIRTLKKSRLAEYRRRNGLSHPRSSHTASTLSRSTHAATSRPTTQVPRTRTPISRMNPTSCLGRSSDSNTTGNPASAATATVARLLTSPRVRKSRATNSARRHRGDSCSTVQSSSATSRPRSTRVSSRRSEAGTSHTRADTTSHTRPGTTA